VNPSVCFIGLGLVACSPASRPAAVGSLSNADRALTAGPTPSAAPNQSTSKSNRFECDGVSTPSRVRVTAEFLYQTYMQPNTWGSGQFVDLSDIHLSYTVSALPPDQSGPRAEFVLEKRDPGEHFASSRDSLDVWKVALDKGLIKQGRTLQVRQQGNDWCLVGRSVCPSSDPDERLFADFLGDSARFVAPLPAVVQGVNGKHSQGALHLKLPQYLAARLRLGDPQQPRAYLVAPGFPAMFDAIELSELEGMVENPMLERERSVMQIQKMATRARVVVDQHCFITEMSTVRSHLTSSKLTRVVIDSGEITSYRWQLSPVR
jgi:hypothetical protein